MPSLIDQFVEQFQQVMANRTVSIFVMLAAACGAIVGIAGGFYGTYLLVTMAGN